MWKRCVHLEDRLNCTQIQHMYTQIYTTANPLTFPLALEFPRCLEVLCQHQILTLFFLCLTDNSVSKTLSSIFTGFAGANLLGKGGVRPEQVLRVGVSQLQGHAHAQAHLGAI